MDHKTNKKHHDTALYITAGALAIILVYYAVMSSMGPSRKMKELLTEFSQEASVKNNINQALLSDSSYLALMKEKAWMQSKNIMAQTDSIYLAINLADSTADIEISGVAVHSAKISSYRLSSILRKGERYAVYSLLSQPLTIESDISTIMKEPVMIKIAPKDTSEYQPDVIPDTSLVEHVNFILYTSTGVRIYVYQEELDKPAEKGSTFRFDLKDRLRQTTEAMKSAALLKVPEYHPYIKIRIPREDVKIIYRALPRKGQVGVYT